MVQVARVSALADQVQHGGCFSEMQEIGVTFCFELGYQFLGRIL